VTNGPSETGLLSNALAFVHGAKTLVERKESGFLASTTLLLGFAAELIAKRRMLAKGASNDDLKDAGHKILKMWERDHELLLEAEKIHGTDSDGLTFRVHLVYLDFFTTHRSGYASRYNTYKGLAPNPMLLVPTLEEIVRRERMR
jgi:hypothetical protein